MLKSLQTLLFWAPFHGIIGQPLPVKTTIKQPKTAPPPPVFTRALFLRKFYFFCILA
jgi:hypothetical protein